MQTLKRSLAKQKKGSLEERVSRFLLTYRTTPHATTGLAPSELLMSRKQGYRKQDKLYKNNIMTSVRGIGLLLRETLSWRETSQVKTGGSRHS